MHETRRNVIVHYHLFKNAGTSVDKLLKHCFKEQWYSYDKQEPGGRIPTVELEQILETRPDILAISSHQIRPPFPTNVTAFPIIFLRHPIVRARSAYLFEWKKFLGLATPKGSFAEYVDHKLSLYRANAIENFQTFVLSNDLRDTFRGHTSDDDSHYLMRAKQRLDALPVFGIVEEYAESIRRFHAWLHPVFDAFENLTFHENVLHEEPLSIASHLERIEQELGSGRYAALLDRNAMDMELYEYARTRFTEAGTL